MPYYVFLDLQCLCASKFNNLFTDEIRIIYSLIKFSCDEDTLTFNVRGPS